jgi:hypothetical protein
MLKQFFLLLFIILSAACKSEPEPIVSYGGYAYFGEYDPQIPESLDDIPIIIRDKLEAHLKSRLGEEFYRSLSLSGGQIVDFDELYSLNPNAKNYEWEVHAYDLHFEFKLPEKGIRSYVAQISLKSDGAVLNEINIPRFGSNPEKLKFVALSDAFKKAKKLGYSEDSKIELVYLKESDSLAWKFWRINTDDGLLIDYQVTEISVHTGLVLNKYSTKAIR